MHDTHSYERDFRGTQDDIMRPGGIALTQHMLKRANISKSARILDIGCGCGTTAAFLHGLGFEALGLDCSPVLIARARARYTDVTFIKGNAEKLPFSDETFDAIFLECVLSIVSIDSALQECRRILRPQGIMIVTDVFDPEKSEGLFSIHWWADHLSAFGLQCICFEDHTYAMKSFAAQWLWDYGSLDGLCSQIGSELSHKTGYFGVIVKNLPGKR
jgi:ubiquinone/menaquinone biosynthesis C-methylase UbiE